MTYTIPTYICARGCNLDGHENHMDVDEYTDEVSCPRCGAPASVDGEREADWVSVAAYLFTGREYGGPEEGGWWYDTHSRLDETLRCFPRGDFPQIDAYIETLRKRFGTIAMIEINEETLGAAALPTTRPYYS